MAEVDDDKIRAAVEELAHDGGAACRWLLALARRLEVSPAEVGRVCNEMKIKIRACQLGCFK